MRARVRLNVAGKDGMTVRDKLLAERRKARAEGAGIEEFDAKLAEPRLPESGRHLWDWFWQLDATRGAGMALQRITFTEIEAWTRLTGALPSPIEIEILQAMDAMRLQATREAPEPDKPQATSQNILGAFMAMMPAKRRAQFEKMKKA